ncbi:hypothetical protein [Nocardia altamirensis]|uniref:hypothetical protein n=1 Tax=Nocardia altamirensis TaxID=472158 RepID=UPI000AA49A76|nr:hypothetical protein [Nocardia altamirensis]
MVARSVVTLGVSTERGAVHAVAFADTGARLPERVLLHRVQQTHGDTKADVAEAVETVMDELAAELGPDHEIAGAAVTYRDAAERRAIVTRLASGRWHTASLVSPKTAHLSVAGVMSWLDEFDDLLICEIVPGYQAFTLIDRGRRRILASLSQAGGATAESLGAAVTAAWDQFEAAAVRPDAVVLIGSAANKPAVVAAVDGFGAPVIPSKTAAAGAAAGAALYAMADVAGVGEPEERVRRVRGGTAVFAAASVLAGGLVVGGVYVAGGSARVPGTVVRDANVTADAKVVRSETGGAGKPGEGRNGADGAVSDRRAPIHGPTVPDLTIVTIDDPLDVGPQYTAQRWGISPQEQPEALVPAEPARDAETNAAAPLFSGSGLPAPTTKVGAPNGSLLFPGEKPPPEAFTPESYTWWDNHFRMMVQWAAQQLMPT